MESKNDITDINFHELGDKKNVKTNSQSRMDPSNSYVLKKDDEGNLNTSSHDEITDTPKTIVEPEINNAESENPITIDQGNEIKEKIIDIGIHVKPNDCGPTSDSKFYRIAIPDTYYKQNSDFVDKTMQEFGFVKISSGALGIVFFRRPMKGGADQ